jgi:hypothetical protein
LTEPLFTERDDGSGGANRARVCWDWATRVADKVRVTGEGQIQ